MAQPFERVKPGDLITANLMNRILNELDSLETRTTALEGGGGGGSGAPIINAPPPPASVRMGDELRIIGKNFGLPAQNVVTMDGATVTQFKAGSNDGLLIFDVPAVQGVPQQGKTVTLTLSNAKGFASTTILLLPFQPTIPTGSLVVSMSQAPADPALLAGQSYIFVFTIQAITTMAETYTLTPSIDQAGWQALAVDNMGNPLSPAEIQIPQGPPPVGVSVTARVRVSIPVGATAGTSAQLRLTVTSKQNPLNLTRTSANVPITVGSAPPPVQDKIIVTLLGTMGGTESGGAVVVPQNDTLIAVNFKVTIKDPGIYTIALPTIQNNLGNLWRTQLMGSQTINSTTPNATPTVQIGVAAKSGAAPTNLVVRVSSAADPTIFGEIQQPIMT